MAPDTRGAGSRGVQRVRAMLAGALDAAGRALARARRNATAAPSSSALRTVLAGDPAGNPSLPSNRVRNTK
jgi:hypothetical protein